MRLVARADVLVQMEKFLTRENSEPVGTLRSFPAQGPRSSTEPFWPKRAFSLLLAMSAFDPAM
jgi:hypothetical protein